MFIQNQLQLSALARDDTEEQVLNLLMNLTEAILSGAQPEKLLSSSVSFSSNSMKTEGNKYELDSYKNLYLISFGKASQKMTKWFLDHFPRSFSRIIIVSPDECEEYLKESEDILFFKGGHPKPNKQSIEAAEKSIQLLEKMTEDDLCLFLISGGGSALFEKPGFDIPFSDYLDLAELLLNSNANIHEINTIRKHFSDVKGGRLALFTKATLVSFIISDVIGNDISSIASGPTSPDKTTWINCKEIFMKYSLLSHLPESCLSVLNQGLDGNLPDSPSEDQLFLHVNNYIVGDNTKIIQEIKNHLQAEVDIVILDTEISGESREVGFELANIAMENYNTFSTESEKSSLILLFGGETTVTLASKTGKGGRNQELALSFALSIKDSYKIYLLSLGTDGIDGNSDAAGAIVGPFTIIDSIKERKAEIALSENNSNQFLKENGGEIITGYTGTNLMDIGVVYITKNE